MRQHTSAYVCGGDMGKSLGHHNIRRETLVSLLMFALSEAAENNHLASTLRDTCEASAFSNRAEV